MAKHLTKEQEKIWETHPDRFDLISVSSKVEKYWVASGFNVSPAKVSILGMQRNDSKFNTNLYENRTQAILSIFFQSGVDINHEDLDRLTCILYAPTHRDHLTIQQRTMLENIDDFDISTLNKFCKDENIFLFLREHAISDAGRSNSKNQLLESNIINISASKFPNVDGYLEHFDVIITDYSGIYFEYLNSEKSIVFALFDLDDQKRNRGLALPDEILFPGYSFSSQQDLVFYLKNRVSIDKRYINQRKLLHSLLFEEEGVGACERTALKIEDIVFQRS